MLTTCILTLIFIDWLNFTWYLLNLDTISFPFNTSFMSLSKQKQKNHFIYVYFSALTSSTYHIYHIIFFLSHSFWRCKWVFGCSLI